MARNDFTVRSFGLRFAFAFALVFLTYNPTGFSWVGGLFSETPLVYKVGFGIVLLIGWAIFLRATGNSLGTSGTILAAAFFGVIIWLFIEWGLVALDDTTTIEWILLFVLTGVLAIGMSWSHIRRKLTGQYDTDEIEG
ncbi:MAG: hypothetical protein GY875_18700 [Gammaproteobacteria bacterium]|nr:hypothetical protein [Gammaproteobacteria bacterium]